MFVFKVGKFENHSEKDKNMLANFFSSVSILTSKRKKKLVSHFKVLFFHERNQLLPYFLSLCSPDFELGIQIFPTE